MRVINDPLDQTHSWFGLRDFEKWERTYERTDVQRTYAKILITTDRDCGRPRGSISLLILMND